MQPIILTADSGSTKTDWLLQDGTGRTLCRIQTAGINPFMQTDDEALHTLHSARHSLQGLPHPNGISFYGAGCRGEQCERMTALLHQVWPETGEVCVGSDLLGAAVSLFADGSGIACILGTGSNSGLYEGGRIVQNVSPLGYILGDEGSGAVLGRRLIGDVLKRQLPQPLCDAFHLKYALTADEIITRVYKQPFANRFLASFAPFLHEQRREKEVNELLVTEFSRFFQRNVAAYNHPELPVSFVGSIAYFFREELTEAAGRCGFHIGQIKRAPLE